tara:strand:- start:27 stop:470 length:444 start_codon:yes stop_codon:yes gene_type:complete
MRITNVDTLSAFFDRLISERIKLYHFENEYQEVEEKKVNHQKDVVSAIKEKIELLFIQSFSAMEYDYLAEERTFGQERIEEVKGLINNVEKLVVNDLDVGAAYYEQKDGEATPEKYMDNELKLREANENRSASKNKIDKSFKKVVEG